VATLKDGLAPRRTRPLGDVDAIYLYLDGFALRVRSAGRVVSVPVLGVFGVLRDGRKQVLALACAPGSRSRPGRGAWMTIGARAGGSGHRVTERAGLKRI
jgi:transposase-like protein